VLIVDAQIHLFGPNAQEHAQRVGQMIVDVERVVAAMDRAGVSRAYLVPAGSAGNQECLDAARRWPDKFKVMGIPGLTKPESRETARQWKLLGHTGARLSFPPFRDPSWLRDGTADWYWPVAQELQIPVMIWAPEQLTEVGQVADRYPALKIIVDHLGLFVEDKGEAVISGVVKQLLPLASRPNVAVKASALQNHSAEAYPHRDLYQPLHEVFDAFGPDRMFWGSDMTRQPDRYGEAITMFTEHLDFLSGPDLEKVMGLGILNWIGW
jgi:L-fuconolactonase